MTPNEVALFNEARRVAIGLSGARLRESAEDAQQLYSSYFAEARLLCIPKSKAWALLASASQSWVTQLVHRLSVLEDIEESQVLMEMAGAENQQVSERG